jgi:hypothetical protein
MSGLITNSENVLAIRKINDLKVDQSTPRFY